jgi:hypothetical protein
MRAVRVILANMLRQVAFRVAFVNCDDVIQEITPPNADKKSIVTSRLPRTTPAVEAG